MQWTMAVVWDTHTGRYYHKIQKSMKKSKITNHYNISRAEILNIMGNHNTGVCVCVCVCDARSRNGQACVNCVSRI